MGSVKPPEYVSMGGGGRKRKQGKYLKDISLLWTTFFGSNDYN